MNYLLFQQFDMLPVNMHDNYYEVTVLRLAAVF